MIAAGVVLALAAPAAGQAAPRCEAPAPKFDAGSKFAGEVRQVIDHQTLCVGRAPNPDTWVKVQLTDLAEVERPGWRARSALRRVALGKYAVCTVSRPDYAETDPVPAVCRVAGVSVGGRARKAN
ncbi:MAG TPA: hypothetical protein VD906_14560 [Caulobacteraceae bacterium]|nr:hypothetical protein [Caulobacteraceae bacterium]